MKRVFKDYVTNTSGQFAVWFSIMAVPLLAGTSYVMDYQSAQIQTGNIKAALDAATLATVQKNNLSDSDKQSFATDVFHDNYSGKAETDLVVEIGENRVHMTARGKIPTTVAAALGHKHIGFFEESEALQTSEDTICVMALSTTADKAVEFSDSVSFNALACSVQSNSKSRQSIYARSSAKPVANSFCAVGGTEGLTRPLAKAECSPIADPYANLLTPPLSPCEKLKKKDDKWPNDRDDDDDDDYDDDDDDDFRTVTANVSPTMGGVGNPGLDPHIEGMTGLTSGDLGPETGSNIEIFPGTYCDGLTIDGRSVTFKPGTYIMQGPLVFKNQAQAVAKDVTFILNGKKGQLVVQSGASLTATAPKVGTYAGLVFVQDSQKKLKDKDLKKSDEKIEKKRVTKQASIIEGGGRLNVVGTVYLPDQNLEVSGTSEIGAQSPALSFIANTIRFSGSTNAYVAADSQKAGLPPMKPRNDNGARLTK